MVSTRSIRTAFGALAFLGFPFGRFRSRTSCTPVFTELSPEDSARLEDQRAVVANAAKQLYGADTLTGTIGDLHILQKLVDDKVFSKSQTYALQCLGVVFGDVLSSQLQLKWAMITDEYGTDPTLRFKDSSLNVNALTMISKRVERDEAVDLSKLLQMTREQLRAYEESSC